MIKYDSAVFGFHKAIQRSRSYFRCVVRCSFPSQYNKQAHSVQNNPGYDVMSYRNYTSNIVIINVDTVYYTSFMIRKCYLESRVFGLLVRHQRHFYNPQCLIFQNTLSLRDLQHVLHSNNKTFAKVDQLAGGMGATSCCAMCSSSEQLSVETYTALNGTQSMAVSIT
jgi:hypothetical protein